MSELSIYVPCDVFPVEISLAASDRVSPLEELALEAVLAECGNFWALADLLRLGFRPTLDLVSDLWQRGYVAVDLPTGNVTLAPHVAALAKSAQERGDDRPFRDLGPAESLERTEFVMQELVSGRVLPLQRRALRPEHGWIVPVFGETPLPDPAELVGVVSMSLIRRGSGTARPMRVLRARAVSSSQNGSLASPERRLIELRALVTFEPALERLTLRVTGPGAISAAVRRSIGTRLEELYPEQAASKIFTNLRLSGIADQAVQSVGARAIDDLAQRVREGAGEEQRAAAADVALAVIDERLRARAVVTPLEGHEEHVAEVRTMLANARRQVVIAAQSLDARLLPSIEDAVIKALQAGRRVLVVHGGPAPLTGMAANTLGDWSAAFPGLFSWAAEPARLQATFVVQDASVAVLTEQPFLHHVSGRRLGLRIEGNPAQAALDLLRYAVSVFPNAIDAARIAQTATQLGSDEPVGLPSDWAAPSQDGPTHGEHERRSRDAAWMAFVEDLRRADETSGDRAMLFIGPRHADAIESMLTTPGRQLVFLVRNVDADVLVRYREEVEGCLRRGTRVTIRYSGVFLGDAARRLETLERSHPQAFTVGRLASDLFAEVLINEHQVLVTRLPLLARVPSEDLKRRRPADLGTWVGGTGAARVVAALRERLGAWIEPISVEAPSGRLTPSSDTAREITRLFRSLSDLGAMGSDGRVADPASLGLRIRDWLRRPDPWQALEQLDRAGFPGMTQAIAACLALHGNRSESSAPWARKLAVALWQQGRFLEVAVLLDYHGSGGPQPLLPHPRILRAAAALRVSRKLNAALEDLALWDSSEPVDVRSAIAVGVLAHLERGSTDAAECLRIWAERAPSPFRDIATAVAAFERVPLDVRALRGSLEAEHAAVEAAEALLALKRWLVETDARVLFATGLGRLTWQRLKAFPPIAPVLEAIGAGDAAGATAALRAMPRRDAPLASLLDEASAAGFLAYGQIGTGSALLLHGGRRAAFLATLRELVERTEGWAALSTGGDTDAALMNAVRSLSAAVAPALEVLDATAFPVGSDAPLLRELRGALQHIREAKP